MRNTARIIRYVHSNINLLNILFVMAIGATLVFAVLPMVRMKAVAVLPKVKAPAVYETPKPAETSPPSPLDYAVIGENNLFHPERRIPPVKKDDKPLPKPELVLYGTVVADGVVLAFIEDKKSPKTTPGRGQRQQVVKKGDVLTGFVLREIETDRIILVRGEEIMTVFLADERKRKKVGAPGTPGIASRSPGAPSPAPMSPSRAQTPLPAPAPPVMNRRPPVPPPVQAQGVRGGNR
jgi:hypothetical protein